jgi:hypothetical protein
MRLHLFLSNMAHPGVPVRIQVFDQVIDKIICLHFSWSWHDKILFPGGALFLREYVFKIPTNSNAVILFF